MGEFIDFGEPLDRNWKDDLAKLIGTNPGLFSHVEVDTPWEGLECSTPWEELYIIKDAVYSIVTAKRVNPLFIKHTQWFQERSKEVEQLRKSSFYSLLKAISLKHS